MKPDELIEKAKRIYGNSADWTGPIADLMPEMLESWINIRQKVADDGALTRKVKEFILIGINLVRRYPSGIENHMKKAIELGATQQEIMEVAGTPIVSALEEIGISSQTRAVPKNEGGYSLSIEVGPKPL